MAKITCSSTKTVARAVRELEEAGWITVQRTYHQANRYRLAWPVDKNDLGQQAKKIEDKPVAESGQIWVQQEDRDVPQSYLNNLPKTYSSRLGEKRPWKRALNDQGTYERRIADRFGPEIWDLLGTLNDIDPEAVKRLCRAEQQGSLTNSDIETARLAVRQTHARASRRNNLAQEVL